MFSEPRIIFHHIPKCGGTSIVTGIVLAYYPLRLLRHGRVGFSGSLNAPASSQTAETFGIDRFTFRRQLLTYKVKRQASHFISGHYPFDATLYEQEKDSWSFVTLLRNPLERWYSEFYWNRYKDHDYRKVDCSVEEYLSMPAGQENARSFIDFFSSSEASDNIEMRKERAIDHLSKLDVVGCLEDLEHFRAQMKSKFGRKPLFLKRNKSPAAQGSMTRPDENSDFHKELMASLEPDFEIYEKTRERLGLKS